MVSVTTNEDEAITITMPEVTDIEDGIITLTPDNLRVSEVSEGAVVVVNADPLYSAMNT